MGQSIVSQKAMPGDAAPVLVRLDTLVSVSDILYVRYKAPRPPPRRQHQGGRPGGVTAPDPPKADPKVSAPLEGACLRGKQMR